MQISKARVWRFFLFPSIEENNDLISVMRVFSESCITAAPTFWRRVPSTLRLSSAMEEFLSQQN